MELLNDDLKSVLAKFGYVGAEIEGSVELDGRYLGPVAEITPKDMHIIVDAVHRGKNLLQNNSLRITVQEFAAHIALPDDAYRLMAALTLLKNKFGTPIYHVAPFGNFMSLHYQGVIENAVIPDAELVKKEEINLHGPGNVAPNDDKSTTVGEKDAKAEITAAKTPSSSMKAEKAEKAKAPVKRSLKK